MLTNILAGLILAIGLVAIWLFGVWLIWLVYGALTATYFTFLPEAWQQMPYWHFAGLLVVVQAFTGASRFNWSSKS